MEEIESSQKMGLELPNRLRKLRLRRSEAVEYLEMAHGIVLAVATLAKWASQGGGPPFERLNRTPLYRRDSLDAWVANAVKPAERSRDNAA